MEEDAAEGEGSRHQRHGSGNDGGGGGGGRPPFHLRVSFAATGKGVWTGLARAAARALFSGGRVPGQLLYYRLPPALLLLSTALWPPLTLLPSPQHNAGLL